MGHPTGPSGSTGYAALSTMHRLLLTLLGFYVAYLFIRNTLFQPHVTILYAVALFFRLLKGPFFRKEKLGVFLIHALFDIYPDHSLWGYVGATVAVLVSGGTKNLVVNIARIAGAIAGAYYRWLKFLALARANQLNSSAIKHTSLCLVFFGHPDRRWEWFSIVVRATKQMTIEGWEDFTVWLADTTKLPRHLFWSSIKIFIIDLKSWHHDFIRFIRRRKDAVIETFVETLHLAAIKRLVKGFLITITPDHHIITIELSFRAFLLKSAFSLSLPAGQYTTVDASTQTYYHSQYNPLPVQLGWRYQRLVDGCCSRCHAEFINPKAYWCGRCKDLVVHNW